MIRTMEQRDLAQCGAVYAQAFPVEHWGIDWTADNATEYLRDFYEQKRFVGYVYEENGKVAGCLFALCKLCGSQKELWINEMAVLPGRQGQGIGRQLLEAAKAYSRENGLFGIFSAENMLSASPEADVTVQIMAMIDNIEPAFGDFSFQKA